MNTLKATTVALSASLLIGGCGPKPSEFWETKLHPLVIEFTNLDSQAASTPRGDLSPIVSSMVAARTEIEILSLSKETPDCAKNGMSSLVLSADGIINAAQDWVSIDFGATEAQIQDHDSRVAAQWTNADEHFNQAVQQITSDCKLDE